jgi:hypothetical protein
MNPQREPEIAQATALETPPAATEPAGAAAPAPAPAPADPSVAAAAPAPGAVHLDTEATPWPEREALARPVEPGKRPARVNTTLPPPPTLRQGLGHRAGIGANPSGLRAGAPLGPTSRAPATRRATMGALAEADPARKTTPEPPRAGADSPPGADGILQRGQTAFDRGDYPEALRRGREAIAAGGALRGHLLAGDAYYRLERFPDALREYQAALALDPGNASIKRRRDLVEQAAAR